MKPNEALAFVARQGIVLQAARGPVPSLAEAVAGAPIRGSWWAHPKGKAIFRAAQEVCESPDVLVCKLVGGKVTYVHRRLWPAVVKLARHFPKGRLAQVREEHTATGAHRSRSVPFPAWVPAEVKREASALPISEAVRILSPWPSLGVMPAPREGRRKPAIRERDHLGRRTAALMACLEDKPGAVAKPMSAPRVSAPGILIYKVMGKMFAILSIRGVENVILKCDPKLAQVLRQQYAGVGHRSHLDRRYWISVNLNADVPADEIERLVSHSYELVRSGLTRKQKAELGALSP